MGDGGPPLWLGRAGRVPYRLAWAWQRELVERRVADEIPDTVLLLEHPHVYTIGKRGSDGDVLASEEWLRALGAEVVRTERGGPPTWACRPAASSARSRASGWATPSWWRSACACRATSPATASP